jgi:hypothetical protein
MRAMIREAVRNNGVASIHLRPRGLETNEDHVGADIKRGGLVAQRCDILPWVDRPIFRTTLTLLKTGAVNIIISLLMPLRRLSLVYVFCLSNHGCFPLDTRHKVRL